MKNLNEYQPLLDKIFSHLIANYEFHSKPELSEVFKGKQKVVTILNHSTPLSWLPAVGVLAQEIIKKSDTERVPVGIMDKFFFKFPLFKPVAEYVTQFNCVPSFDDVIQRMESQCTDVAIFPEGSNCFFGQGETIQPFRSPRFIELSLRLNAPIFLAVHRGSENWAHAFRMNRKKFPLQAYFPSWLNEKIHNGGFLVVPKIPQKIEKFRMVCDFYEPQIKFDELSEKRSVRMKQLWSESEQVRHKMQNMFDSLAS